MYYDRNLLTIDFRVDVPAVLDYDDYIIIRGGVQQPTAPEGYQYWKRALVGWRQYDYYFAKIITPASDGFKYTGLYGQTLVQNGYTWPAEYRWTSSSSGGNTLPFLDSFIFDNLPAYGSPTTYTTYITVYDRILQVLLKSFTIRKIWMELGLKPIPLKPTVGHSTFLTSTPALL